MTLAQSIRTCLRKFARFSGRATRSEFWWFALTYWLILWAIAIVVSGFAGGGLFLIVAWAAATVPMLAVSFRRLHDMGRPGWLIFLTPAVPLAMLVLAFALVVVFALAAAIAEWNPLGDIGEALAAMWAAGSLAGMMATSLLQVRWLTRPSQPHDNRYGPSPVDAPEKIF